MGQVRAGLGSQERRWGESGLRLGQRADRRGLHQCHLLFGKGQRRFLEEACASLNNSRSHDFLSSFPAVLVAITCRVCESPVAGTRVGDSPGLQGVFSQRRLPRRRGAQGLCQGGRGGAGGAAWLSGLKAARRREGRAKRRRRGPLPRTLRGEWKRTGGGEGRTVLVGTDSARRGREAPGVRSPLVCDGDGHPAASQACLLRSAIPQPVSPRTAARGPDPSPRPVFSLALSSFSAPCSFSPLTGCR